MAKMPAIFRLLTFIAAAESLGFAGVSPVLAAPPATPATAAPVPSPYSYADVADVATIAPAVIAATIRKTIILPPERAPGVRAGHIRLFVEADVESMIRGSGALARRITFLADLPLSAKGKPPKLKKARVLLFARFVPGTTSQIQLVAPDAMLAGDAATEALARKVLTEAVKADAPPRITGIANGFHVPGNLPGEGETQIFLKTETGLPVSLSVIRGAEKPLVWAAAFGEIVDDSAAVPARNTLGWYRLACGLPRILPDTVMAGTEGTALDAARADYAFVLGQLGDCPRTRTPPAG
jgi:hypothetical protein